VKSIGWFSGGENGSDGIYVRHGLKSTCVLPGISQKKAHTITDTIKARFPQFGIESGSVIQFSIGVGR